MVVNSIREFLERATELLDNDECDNPSPGSPVEEACQACDRITACTSAKVRKDCVCRITLQADLEKCNNLATAKDRNWLSGNLKEACSA